MIWMPITANSVRIGWVEIRCLSRDRARPPAPDGVAEYEYDVVLNNAAGAQRRDTGIVSHRYGDGAAALIARVLLAAGRAVAEAPLPVDLDDARFVDELRGEWDYYLDSSMNFAQRAALGPKLGRLLGMYTRLQREVAELRAGVDSGSVA